MTERYDALRAAAAKASNGNLDSAESVSVDEIVCPFCGDGIVERKMWMNIDNKPVGIEVFGLGEALTNYETFVRLANPETIKTLLSERDSLLAALNRIAAIPEKVCEPFQDGLAAQIAAAALTTKEG